MSGVTGANSGTAVEAVGENIAHDEQRPFGNRAGSEGGIVGRVGMCD
jgi:hypothetical protein